MSNCHRPLSMWFGEDFESEEESSEEGSLDPETMGLDRPLSLHKAQKFFNHYLYKKDLLSSKKHLIRLERAVSMGHMQIRNSQTISSDLNEIMSYIVRNIERLIRDRNLVPPLFELFQQIQYRAQQEVELRDSQKIEVHSKLSIEVRGKQIRNENPFRVLGEKCKLAEKIEMLDSIHNRMCKEGIANRKTEKNRKVREKKREKERKKQEREEVIESVDELPYKRFQCEERSIYMQEVRKKVKDYEEFPKDWLVNVGFLDEEDRIEKEVIYDKYGGLDLQDETRIFESDTEIPEEGAVLPQDQDGFNLHEEYKEVISTLDPDKQTAKSADHEGVYNSSLDNPEESKLPQYTEESKLPIYHDKPEPIIKLHKIVSSEESDSAEELSNQSHSESEYPNSQHDEADIFSWYIVPNEELSSYQGHDNDMIIPESRCLSRFPF